MTKNPFVMIRYALVLLMIGGALQIVKGALILAGVR